MHDISVRRSFIQRRIGVCSSWYLVTMGTPISNSMTELYTLMRYLQADLLKDVGIQHFDEWAADFGEVTTDFEYILFIADNPFYTGFDEYLDEMTGLESIHSHITDGINGYIQNRRYVIEKYEEMLINGTSEKCMPLINEVINGSEIDISGISANKIGKAMYQISERSETGHAIVDALIRNSISFRRWGRFITIITAIAALVLYGLSYHSFLIRRWIPISGDIPVSGQYHILFSAAWLYFSVVLVIRAMSMLVCDAVKMISEE